MSGETPRKHSENAGQREETTEEKCPFNTIPWSVEFPIERKRKKKQGDTKVRPSHRADLQTERKGREHPRS